MEVTAETAVLIREYENAKEDVAEAKQALKYASHHLDEVKRERKRARHKVRQHLAKIIPHEEHCLVRDIGVCDCPATEMRTKLREQVLSGNYQEEPDDYGHCVCPGWDGVHEPDCEYKDI